MASPRLLCFGLGYSASVFARALLAEGGTVAGTCRSAEQAAALESFGIRAFLFERGRPLADLSSVLDGATCLLSSVPPDEQGDPVLDEHGGELASLGRVSWVGYLSTTGVYGDRAGGTVDEESPLEPTSARALRRVAAEAGWLGLWRAAGLPVHVFRLAGIYGPGRSVLDQLRAGTAKRIDKPGHVFSRIHVADIAAVLRASIARPRPGAIYNVCDDNPAPSAEVVAHGAHLLGLVPPPLVPFDAAQLSPLAASFYQDNKRVANQRIKTELGVTLRYPDYRSGLAAILAEGG